MRTNTVTPLREVAEPRPLEQREGELIGVEGPVLRVRVHGLQGATVEARRAVSCLVAPAIGDRVLVAVGDRCWVLAVLEREEGGPIAISTDEDLRLESAGRLVLGGRESVDVATPGALRLTSRDTALESVSTTVTAERLSVFARAIRAESRSVQAVLDVVDSTLERLSQRVKRVYRFVEEMDVTRANQIDYRAENVASLRGRHTVMTAEELVKVDGKQIHLG
jgi:hypothetical protein